MAVVKVKWEEGVLDEVRKKLWKYYEVECKDENKIRREIERIVKRIEELVEKALSDYFKNYTSSEEVEVYIHDVAIGHYHAVSIIAVVHGWCEFIIQVPWLFSLLYRWTYCDVTRIPLNTTKGYMPPKHMVITFGGQK